TMRAATLEGEIHLLAALVSAGFFAPVVQAQIGETLKVGLQTCHGDPQRWFLEGDAETRKVLATIMPNPKRMCSRFR
ncbi:hypothetical protein, partial [Klebsiella pneumoniae]|uniref:hypothetical protein n=1 Tax=Klebsiella pneumoniae TaxID=573 RepID=UPI0019547D12